jgi:hypothetical protein
MIYVTKQRARIYLQSPMVGNPGEKIEDLTSAVKRNPIIVEDPRELKKIVT